jgi:UTP--glucose-1-phosphate uridylyltransferase
MTMVTNKHKKAIENHFKPQVDIEKSIKNTTKEVLLDEINAISEQCDFSYIEKQEMHGILN